MLDILSAQHIAVALQEQPILRDLSLRLSRGEWTGLVGPNGSGKTTLLRTIGGLLPYDGSLALFGKDARALSPRERARRLAFVRQSLILSFDLSLQEYVLLGRAPHKSLLAPYSKTDYALVDEALEAVEMARFARRSIRSLSGGEQQRVVLAQALVQQADLLLLDEPTSHLDVHHQFEFLERVRSLTAGGHTVLSVFHDLELATRYSDRLLVIDGGRLVDQGRPAEVLSEELLRDVFRMRTRTTAQADGSVRIHYLENLHTASAAPA